jgi:hypothetical protein
VKLISHWLHEQCAPKQNTAGVLCRRRQQIVAQGISPQLLEWKGIEATESLAKSPNSKVVVIGNNRKQ